LPHLLESLAGGVVVSPAVASLPLLLHDAPPTHADSLRAESLEHLRSLWRYLAKVERLYGKGSFPEGTPEQWRAAVRAVAELVKAAPSDKILEIDGHRQVLRNMVARAMGLPTSDGTTGGDRSVVLDGNW
jgi:hypothetical protein